jgi:hypothetical protein
VIHWNTEVLIGPLVRPVVAGIGLLWAWLLQRWPGWRAALHVVQPATVLV